MADAKSPSVLVIYTGGTIGMKNSEQGYAPADEGDLEKFLKCSDIFGKCTNGKFVITNTEADLPAMKVTVSYKVVSMHPQLDSSNISQREWNTIAEKIKENYAEFHGFVVLHGTDTMVYTASALSFMCENLAKPIVITGSQIPIYEARSDARDNLINSIIVAGTSNIPEVLLYFGSDVFRGNRCVKSDNSNFAPFISPNHNRLIRLGVRAETDWNAVGDNGPTDDKPAGTGSTTELVICTMPAECKVGILHLYPGIPPEMVKAIVKQLDGVVLLSYGAGNAPTNDGFMKALKGEQTNRKLMIINVTQCHTGAVTGAYETGQKLAEIGVVPGGDITTEAAFCKLCYLLAKKDLTHDERIKKLKIPLRKEMTRDSNSAEKK
ncbi:hypothetical protein V1264_018325 [Littorina saxatilis]|uniref:asparaginase n=2 Tax=Littorina saxatilis TaxID=31220 RepID=A0AAN9GE22_9CAEN